MALTCWRNRGKGNGWSRWCATPERTPAGLTSGRRRTRPELLGPLLCLCDLRSGHMRRHDVAVLGRERVATRGAKVQPSVSFRIVLGHTVADHVKEPEKGLSYSISLQCREA